MEKGIGIRKQIKEEVVTCAEAAKELNTTTQTIRRWIAMGTLNPKSCFQVGKRGRWRIYRSALREAQLYSKGGLDSKWVNSF